MHRRRKPAHPGSFTPRIKIYDTIDLVAVDRAYPILCSDTSHIQVDDELAFLRSEFTPFTRSSHIRDDLIEAMVVTITRGIAALDYRFLNGEAAGGLKEGQRWKGMRPATLVKIWCKRRRRPQEDQDETFLDPKNLPFIVERLASRTC